MVIRAPQPDAPISAAAISHATAEVVAAGSQAYSGLKVALLTNLIPPYRIPIYAGLAKVFNLSIFYSGFERNRDYWSKEASVPGATAKKSRGFTINRRIRREGTVDDLKSVHVTPGFLIDLLSLRPDGVISTEMGFRTVAAWLYGRLFQKPIWVWWGGTRHSERNIGPTRRLLRWFLTRRVRRWLSYGNSSTDYLVSLGVPRATIVELQNCIDQERYSRPTAATLHIEPRPVLLHVGQLVGRKGIDKLLEAAARIQRQGQTFSLALIGGGPAEDSLRRLASTLELKHVYFLGPKPSTQLPGIYRSADALIFPTLEDVWGLVVNEALWSGLPVLGSIYAGSTGELLPPENRFDPLDEEDLDQKLLCAIQGRLASADVSRLKTVREVTESLLCEIRAIVEASR